MQFECALFILVVVGMACAVIAALSSLFWPRDLEPHEKSIISNWKRLKNAKPTRYGVQGCVRLQMVWDNLSCLGTEALARLG
jgi:hypothetical protein